MRILIYAGLIGLLVVSSLYVYKVEKEGGAHLSNYDTKASSPEELLNLAIDDSRYLSTRLVAEKLINDDPSFILVDVRTIYENEEYHIPGSINIPLEELIIPDWEAQLDQEARNIVFYSNSDIYADQAWLIGTQKGYKNLYVMKGGLNEFFSTIMKPTLPADTESSEAFEQYAFDRAASIYFGGSAVKTSAPTAPKEVVVRKKAKKAAEGGC